MDLDERQHSLPLHKGSIISLLLGLTAGMMVCAALLPIPFSELVCIPAGVALGVLAVIWGVASLIRLRSQNASGRTLAWLGILIGGLVTLCLLCMILPLLTLYLLAPESIQAPPFINKYF